MSSLPCSGQRFHANALKISILTARQSRELLAPRASLSPAKGDFGAGRVCEARAEGDSSVPGEL